MKVVVNLAGLADHRRTLVWPEGWPIPREGESVSVDLNSIDGPTDGLRVRTVVWYPEGSSSADPEPFVYLVVGKPRPSY